MHAPFFHGLARPRPHIEPLNASVGEVPFPLRGRKSPFKGSHFRSQGGTPLHMCGRRSPLFVTRESSDTIFFRDLSPPLFFCANDNLVLSFAGGCLPSSPGPAFSFPFSLLSSGSPTTFSQAFSQHNNKDPLSQGSNFSPSFFDPFFPQHVTSMYGVFSLLFPPLLTSEAKLLDPFSNCV